MKSRLLKKFIAYGFLPFMVVFLSVSPFLGVTIVHAQGSIVREIGGAIGEIIGTGFAGFLVGMNIILSSILYFIGKILDFAIQYSIAPNVNSDAGPISLYASETVNTAWTLLRDIINMSFIFILLYVAIGTVLNIQNVNWKKQVSQIIIAAILVNFSLFITRVVIDAGNIIANGFYQELTVCDPACIDSDGNSRPSVGISERFAAALGITYVNELRDGTYDTGYRGWQGVGVALMQMILILTAIWVFFSVAILFIARIFALVFILVLSPIGVAGSSLPLLGKFAQQWREQLFKQTMLGVVFLFFTFIILLFASLEGEGILDGSTFSIDDVNEELLPVRGPEGGPRTESIFIMYTLVIAGLIMSLRLTKNLSGQIGKFADGLGKGAVGLGLGVAAGGTALIGRQTVGRAAQATLDSQRGKDIRTAAEGGDRRALAQYNALKNTAGGSFDVRTTKLGGVATKQASKLGGIAGLNASVGVGVGKGGRTAQIKKEAEADAKSIAEFSPAGLRKYAEMSEAKTQGRMAFLSPATGVRKERVKELKKMADRKETTKEERERTIGKASSDIRENEGSDKKIREILGKLKSNELRDLPPDILENTKVMKNLHIGDLQAIKDSIDRGTKQKIYEELYTSPSTSVAMKDYLEKPENGWVV